MTIAIALFVLMIVAAIALGETGPRRQRRAEAVGGGAPLAGEALLPASPVEPAVASADVPDEITLDADPGSPISATSTLTHDIVAASAPGRRVLLIEDGHLIETQVIDPVRAHERARALGKLAVVLLLIGAACGGILILIGRLIGGFFSRFTG